jgi:DNA-directed RNA polymerase specialized sigma24 family protein
MSSHDSEHAWFIEQVRIEQAGLRAFVRSLGMRPDAADDVAQESFLVAY